MRRIWSVSVTLGSALMIAGCSSGPQPPQAGTPAFYWSAAKTTFAAGDFLKAGDNLSQLASGSSEFATRSQPWSMMISAGVVRAYAELADNFDAGARINRANPTPFRRQASTFRSQAGAAALQYAEMVHKFLDTNKAATFALDFDYPTGSAAEPVQLQRVSKGIPLPDADIESLQKAMVQRGVLLSVAHAVGAADDTAKALDIFKKGDGKIERPVLLVVTARALCDQADLFSPKKLDRPDRVTMLVKEAEEALAGVPETKETKELTGRIAKLRKASKSS